MRNLNQKQQGITFIGLCFVLGIIAILVLFAVRAFPLYNEAFQVTAAINSVIARPDAADLKDKDVYKYFLHNMEVTNIQRFDNFNVRDYVKVIQPAKAGQPKIMEVKYEARNILFGNLYLLMDFDKKVPLGGGKTGE